MREVNYETGKDTNGSSLSNKIHNRLDVGNLQHRVCRTLEQDHGDVVVAFDEEGFEGGDVCCVYVMDFLWNRIRRAT